MQQRLLAVNEKLIADEFGANVIKLLKFHFRTHLPAFLNFGGSQKLGDQYIVGPRASKVGGTGPPVSMVVAPLVPV